jgi:polyisoprenoid-binding protein YceI
MVCSRVLVALSIVAGLATSASAAAYKVGPGSKITYHVVHPMHEVNGVNGTITGSVEYDAAKPLEFKGLSGKFVQANWKDFDSGNKNRDANTISVVNAEHFPQVTYVIESVENPRQEGAIITGTLRGRLYINGVKQPLSGPLTVDISDPKAIKVHSKLETKMTDFKLEPPALMFIKSANEVSILIDLVFVP